MTYALLMPLGAFVLLGLVRREASIRRLRLFALCISITVLAGVTGCSSTPTKAAAPGVAQVVVTATSGALTQSVQVTVNVAN
jgi:hypothetical protein